MANLKAIKTKINSIKNLKKITTALEIVSTVKLQKVKAQTEHLKSYFLDLYYILSHIGDPEIIFGQEETNPRADHYLVVLISTDRWLAGALNHKLFKKLFDELKDQWNNIDFFVIGKKGLEFINRSWGNVVGFLDIPDSIEEKHFLPLMEYIYDSIKQGKYQKILSYFNFFKNVVVQIPASLNIYPLDLKAFEDLQVDLSINLEAKPESKKDFLIEPDLPTVIKEFKRQVVNYLIMASILQNKTWEFASRMLAMKNAKDNSTAMIKDLTLIFNKERQAKITQEVSEIVSAKEAIEW